MGNDKHWILGSRRRDFSFLVLPGAVGLAFGWLLPAESRPLLVYLVLVTAVFDSGHVYTTLLRTYANPQERGGLLYKIVPPLVVAFFAFWFFLGFAGLWSFVVYATAYHHIRQYYGVSRWYQKKEGRFRRAAGWFVYALTLVPLLAYHFRPGAKGEFYSENDLFLTPNSEVFAGLQLGWAALVVAWVAYEILTYAKEKRLEPGRVLSVGVPGALYAGAFFTGNTPAQVLAPLMLAHGVGYFGMMAWGLHKTRPASYQSWVKALAIIVVLAACLGGAEALLEEYVVEFDSTYPYRYRSGWEAVVLGLYLVPLFTHFIIDAVIWRGKHREAKLIYS